MGKICLRICCALALVVFVSASQACAGDGGSRTADMLVQAGGRNVAWMKSLHDTLPVCKVLFRVRTTVEPSKEALC